MSFERPTLPALIAQARGDAEARLTDGAPLLPVSNVAVLAQVHAGAVHGLYGYLDWIGRQILPDTSDEEVLLRQASLRGLSRLAAAYASGSVTLTGADVATLPAGSVLRRADGVLYATDADATIVGGSATVVVDAAEAGAGGNAAAGVGLALTSPVAGISSAAVVAAGGLTGGADMEGVEALRARLLAVLREPPQGGALHDYVAWALAGHPLVTRAWVYPGELGAGTVTVRLATDGATVGGIPESAVVAAVQAAIDAQRPVTAEVVVVAPVAAPLDLSIGPSPSTAAVRDAIAAALAEVIERDGEPGGTLRLSRLREAISGAAGEEWHALIAPVADVAHAAGQLPVLGTITWA